MYNAKYNAQVLVVLHTLDYKTAEFSEGFG